MQYLKMEELKDGYLYRIRARNGAFGIWVKNANGFILSRTKFGANFTFMEYHYDTGSPFGTVMPLYEIEASPFPTPESRQSEYEQDMLLYLNKFEVPHEEERLLAYGLTPERVEEMMQKNNYFTQQED